MYPIQDTDIMKTVIIYIMSIVYMYVYIHIRYTNLSIFIILIPAF